MSVGPPVSSVRSRRAVAASADQLATQAAMTAFALGGNAVDAAVAANAAIAVTGPHLCGLGGDLFALVRSPDGEIHALNATGRAGSGADPDAVRAAGHSTMPMRHDVRSVTVPGCVDGWMALHHRFGVLALAEVFGPAIRLAATGFPASPLLVGSLLLADDAARRNLAELAVQASHPGAPVTRPGVALALQAIVTGGRRAFYEGAFGEGLLELGAGEFTVDDLARVHADWVEPLTTTAFGVQLTTIGPNSQGYLALGAARLAAEVGVPEDPDDAQWAHLLVEMATAAGFDRPELLHEGADGNELVETVAGRAGLVDPTRASGRTSPAATGDTTYLCTADDTGMAVSLIQSNASGFGSGLVEPTTGINLHNRGLGFNLQPGHPAEYGPGRRPPHTLCPAMATRDGQLAAVLGAMGGDGQPQILLQLIARLFVASVSASPAAAVGAGRWLLRGPATGFDTWTGDRPPAVVVEGHASAAWRDGLAARGHAVVDGPAFDSGFGHAHVITVDPSGTFAAAADPRARVGSAAGQ
ncbi:MAG: gamma-glutamyltransferase family protein [Ilumatobacteraceae bacterium]